ncbi:DUF3822 family protein [Maribacter algicola]|uniref:DUF3822 family protein n=1 Tax=Meishania litoralis TaxID=3434685 RepID=A0ACC7LLU1_9FLAO
MTKKITNNTAAQAADTFEKLSIQVSLNGLSFCILDTIANTILDAQNSVFENEQPPHELHNRLRQFLKAHKIDEKRFCEVVVIHRNPMFSLVPRPLFEKNELANYLKFNTKILAGDQIVHDEVPNHEIVNVYIPFSNVNNYIFDLYGEFEFQHNATITINSLLNEQKGTKDIICYVNVGYRQMDVAIISNRRLLLYNSFDFYTKEDFIYYLLFALEQLKLDPHLVPLKLFGTVEEGDEIYELCFRYIKNVSVFVPSKRNYPVFDPKEASIDFTILSTL